MIRMIQFICRSLSSILGRVPSLVYAIGFLALIPVFATVFAAHSGEFYHTTVKHERYYHEIRDRIMKEMQQAVTRSGGSSSGKLIRFNGFELDTDGIIVTDIQAQGDGVRVDLLLQLMNNRTARSESRVIAVMLSDLYGLSKEKNGETYHYYTALPYDQQGASVPLAKIFPGDTNYPSSKAAFVPITPGLHRDFKAFLDGARGFPSDEAGMFPRMLYLSAVSITTLGYGDIVPISDQARFLVSLESVLGLILVGLFLNSLSYERDQARERKKAKKK